MLNKLRKVSFFILDFIKGSPLRKALGEIESINSLDFDDEQLKIYQSEKVNELLKFSQSNNPYYRKYQNYEFEEMPLINKNILKENDMISDSYKKTKLYEMATSGSTGIPFICYQNEEKKKRVNAEIIYYSKLLGYDIGNKLIYLRSLSKKCNKSKFKQFLQNQYLIDCFDLSDRGIQKIMNRLERYTKFEPSVLLAYGSTYLSLKEVNENHKAKIIGSISGADMLYDDSRESIKKLFNCPCVSRYSNEENGVIGQDLDNGMNNVFIINEANYLVEIFDLEKDSKVDDGIVGRIVITDFFNYAMPFIRYDTGDVGAIEVVKLNGKNRRVIKDFGGRKSDIIYNIDGSVISSANISTTMWEFTEIKQFQFIQLKYNEYKLVLNVRDKFNKENVLRHRLSALLGNSAILNIEYIDEIPVLNSGKRKYMVNEWKK